MVLAEVLPIAAWAGEFVRDPIHALALLATVHHVLTTVTAHQGPAVRLFGVPARVAETDEELRWSLKSLGIEVKMKTA